MCCLRARWAARLMCLFSTYFVLICVLLYLIAFVLSHCNGELKKKMKQTLGALQVQHTYCSVCMVNMYNLTALTHQFFPNFYSLYEKQYCCYKSYGQTITIASRIFLTKTISSVKFSECFDFKVVKPF